MTILQVLLRTLAAVLCGAVIGNERARHGQAAGMRTHILVCLGACMTAMSSVFVAGTGSSGDVFRIPAQVVSGIGFLGAGMIILKNNNMITGLTTAAGVWTTGTIGIALGYGFYTGASVVTLLFLATVVLLAKLEKSKKSTQAIYVEVHDLSAVNAVLKNLQTVLTPEFTYQITPPKSGQPGHLGLSLQLNEKFTADLETLCRIEHLVFAVFE